MTSADLFSKRIAVTLFHFTMNIAKIPSRFKRNVRRSTNNAWRILLFSRISCPVSVHSLKMFFTKPTSSAYRFASFHFTGLSSSLIGEYVPSFMVPFHMANRAKCHEIFFRIVSPISVDMMNFKSFFYSTSFAGLFKKSLSRLGGEALSFSVLLLCEIFIPFANFHGWTITAPAGVV